MLMLNFSLCYRFVFSVPMLMAWEYQTTGLHEAALILLFTPLFFSVHNASIQFDARTAKTPKEKYRICTWRAKEICRVVPESPAFSKACSNAPFLPHEGVSCSPGLWTWLTPGDSSSLLTATFLAVTNANSEKNLLFFLLWCAFAIK